MARTFFNLSLFLILMLCYCDVNQERWLTESFKSMGAKSRMRAASKSGKADVAKGAAAAMLQASWRARRARREMEVRKAERERLRAERAAAKVQSRYRCRLARRKVARIREERQILRESAYAIKIQVHTFTNLDSTFIPSNLTYIMLFCLPT
jgi:hypothetical protein